MVCASNPLVSLPLGTLWPRVEPLYGRSLIQKSLMDPFRFRTWQGLRRHSALLACAMRRKPGGNQGRFVSPPQALGYFSGETGGLSTSPHPLLSVVGDDQPFHYAVVHFCGRNIRSSTSGKTLSHVNRSWPERVAALLDGIDQVLQVPLRWWISCHIGDEIQ